VAVDPIRPVGPRRDLAPVTRVQLSPVEREEQRRERDERRRRRRASTPEAPVRGDDGGLDLRA
jgi:hypothetical protein